jgi:hypothetical protein
MPKIIALIIAIGFFTGSSMPCSADSPLCLAGCVRAEVKGLPEIADALRQWAQLLPALNEQFHEKVQDDLRAMDLVASDLVDKLDRTYGKNLDRTTDAVKQLIADATNKINSIGDHALKIYNEALFSTECTVVSITDIFANKIEESIPRFQWIRSLFGEKFNVYKSTDFNGNTIDITFDPDSRTDRFQAAYNLMTMKLASATEDTKLENFLAVALDRQTLAYSYYCDVRSSIGASGTGHVYEFLQTSRKEYLALSRLVQGGFR